MKLREFLFRFLALYFLLTMVFCYNTMAPVWGPSEAIKAYSVTWATGIIPTTTYQEDA